MTRSVLRGGALFFSLVISGWPADTAEDRASAYMTRVRRDAPLLRAFLQEMPKGGDLHKHLAFLFSQIVDAFSMRGWVPGRDSGQDHFFAAFSKFDNVAQRHPAEMMAEVIARAAAGHVQHVEIMYTLDRGQAIRLGNRAGWDKDFDKLRERLLSGRLRDIVGSTRKDLDAAEAQIRGLLHCGTTQADPGCDISVRHIYQGLRGFAPEEVFAHVDAHKPRIGATQLEAGQTAPENLRFHIREAIEKGAAERIGHGTSVMHEREPIDLLKDMAKRGVLVEISLTSSDFILGVRGADHPLPVYLRYGVPVALATDDEGVSRSDITAEYLRAAQTYALTYESAGCSEFLKANERARVQSKLEAELARFESRF